MLQELSNFRKKEFPKENPTHNIVERHKTMGTNYYLESDICPTCGHTGKRLHIGKSNAGWTFALHVHPDEGINSLDDWQKEWLAADVVILDEYGSLITPDVMLTIITERSFPPRTGDVGNFCEEFNAEPGPNGLYRAKIDGDHCIGHGEGTWDLVAGNFS